MVDGVLDLRSISEAFTGAPFRLELACAIARLPTATFANKDLAAVLASDFEQPTLSRNLAALTSAGFLKKRSRGTYTRLASPVWSFVLALEASQT